jgi:copper resistance protein C
MMRSLYWTAVAIPFAASPAFAHAFLERASPPVGSEVAASPPELFITFTEGVEPLFSTIEVENANGAAVSTGKPHLASNNDRQLVIELPKLAPGPYKVIWHVTSVDTHKTEGTYRFTVSR